MSNKPTTAQIQISESATLNTVVGSNGSINATEIQISGVPVVNSTGVWVGSSSGLVGAQGATGAQGITGTGVQGATGIQGSTGAQGIQGISGSGGSGSSGEYPQSVKTSPYVLTLSDVGKHIKSNAKITIPSNANVSFNVGTHFYVYNNSSGTLLLEVDTDTITESANTFDYQKMVRMSSKSLSHLFKIGATEWVIEGNKLVPGKLVQITDRTITYAGGFAGYGLTSSGTELAWGNGTGSWAVNLGSWLIVGVVGDYDVRYTQQSGDAVTFENGATENTWIRMTASHPRFYKAAGGTNPVVKVELRSNNTQELLATANVTFSA